MNNEFLRCTLLREWWLTNSDHFYNEDDTSAWIFDAHQVKCKGIDFGFDETADETKTAILWELTQSYKLFKLSL